MKPITRPSAIPIITIRGQKVVLDSDLAAIYGVTTKRLNEQFRRNRKRFPKDFAFQLTPEDAQNLKSQFATSSSHAVDADTGLGLSPNMARCRLRTFCGANVRSP